MNSVMKVVTIEQKKCLIINYDFIQKPNLPAIQNGFSGFCFDCLYKKTLKTIDSINCEQYSYYYFIQESWLDIERAKNLKEIDKICFVKNPKEVITKFDMNVSKLKNYTNKNSFLRTMQYSIPLLKGLAWFVVFGIILVSLVLIFSVKNQMPLQVQDVKNYTLQTSVSSNIFIEEVFIDSTRDSAEPYTGNPIINTMSSTFHRISNITEIITKPFFNLNPLTTLTTMFSFMVFIMVITSVASGFFSTNSTINKKIEQIPKLNTEAREYFSNADDPYNTEYKGIKYFTYDVHDISSI